jgi:pantetheine-phosphate adenylyltransferase
MKKAVFPGSFDPFTLGHLDIINRGLTLFDELIIAIGVNSDKKYMFSLDQRKKFIEDTFTGNPKIKVVTYEGLTVDFL